MNMTKINININTQLRSKARQGRSRPECGTCNSSGSVRCGTCNGKGKIRDIYGFMIACYECRGTGRLPCPICR